MRHINLQITDLHAKILFYNHTYRGTRQEKLKISAPFIIRLSTIFPIFQLTSLTFSEVELFHLIRSGSLRSKLLEVVGGTENRAREGHKPEK